MTDERLERAEGNRTFDPCLTIHKEFYGDPMERLHRDQRLPRMPLHVL
jgi:hypothetical protein